MCLISHKRFLTIAILLTALVSLPSTAAAADQAEPLLKGFVVADAHFGWKHSQQPAPETIQVMMSRITDRFGSDLDVFLDVGDAHHGIFKEKDAGQWTDIIAGGCGPIPFFYTPGNHEIDTWRLNCDVELRCMQLGNTPCRPYYSFDLKGVHFISMPQLLFMSYVSRETLNWVKLDLSLNKTKSVIFLTHNSVKGTTEYHDDPGYRRLANSDEIMDLFEQYPNILGWMHGHNHTYEVVEKDGRLFASCGRIGGFDPPYEGEYGKGNLGGMYFEVGPDRLTIRGYSASKRKFLDKMGYPQHSKTLKVKTSFDPHAPATFSYGAGGALDAQRIAVAHHYVAGTGGRKLYVTGIDGTVINENPDFAVYTERTHPLAPNKNILPGYRFSPHDDNRWQRTDAGVRILALDSADDATMMVAPGPNRGRISYYRLPSGEKYRLTLDLESPTGGQQIQLRCRVHDRYQKEVASIDGGNFKINPGMQTIQTVFQLPSLAEVPSIYSNPTSDNTFNVLFELKCSNLLNDLTVRRFAVEFDGAAVSTTDPAVIIDGKEYKHQGKLRPGQTVNFDLPDAPPARSVYQTAAKGNRRLSWLVRQSDLVWQVRNAPVARKKDYLDIGPLRNIFTLRKEVVVVPFKTVDDPYVHRLRNVNGARIYPLSTSNRKLTIQVLATLGPAEIEIGTGRKPRQITGTDTWNYAQGTLILSIKIPGTYVVKF